MLRFAVGESTLGAILVASGDKGVAAILIGDDPAALVDDLQDQFPNAQLIGADRDFEALVAKVVGFVEAPGMGSTCPSTCAAPRFRSGFGMRWLASPPARQ